MEFLNCVWDHPFVFLVAGSFLVMIECLLLDDEMWEQAQTWMNL